MGFLVPVTKDREKLETQIKALEWALSQDEDEKSRTYHAAFLEILKKEREAMQGDK